LDRHSYGIAIAGSKSRSDNASARRIIVKQIDLPLTILIVFVVLHLVAITLRATKGHIFPIVDFLEFGDITTAYASLRELKHYCRCSSLLNAAVDATNDNVATCKF
jgi:hypothetical protein